jgi:hypothetical protein
LDLIPLGYLRSLGAKKNHSGSSERIKDFSVEKRNRLTKTREGAKDVGRTSTASNQIASWKGENRVREQEKKDLAEFEGIASNKHPGPGQVN